MAHRRRKDLNVENTAGVLQRPGNEELISRALVLQDAAAFDELVVRNQSRVRGWLRHLAGDAALADDLAQETFLRAWRKLGTFKATGSFEAWLLTIARNEFLQHVRKSGREAHRMDELRHATETDETANGGAGLSSEAEQHDLNRVLRMLKPEERDLMILVYGLGLTHSEASEVSGMPVGTVKSHVRRGAARVRERVHFEERRND